MSQQYWWHPPSWYDGELCGDWQVVRRRPHARQPRGLEVGRRRGPEHIGALELRGVEDVIDDVAAGGGGGVGSGGGGGGVAATETMSMTSHSRRVRSGCEAGAKRVRSGCAGVRVCGCAGPRRID